MENTTKDQKTTATEQKPGEEHVVKMWTPYNIKVDENYAFIPSKAFERFSIGLKGFAAPILMGIDKLAFSLKINGKENAKPLEGKGFITVCNHVNILDCTMVGVALNRKDIVLTTIKENFEIPVVRLFVKALGAIPIPRSVKGIEKFSEAVDTLLAQGKVIHFYPEGILFPYYNGLRGFRRGAFAYAVKNNVPILPMVITYHDRHSKIRKSPTAQIHILPPVYRDETLKTEREQIKDMKQRVTKAMQDKFDQTDCLKDNTEVIAKFKPPVDLDKMKK